MALIYKRRTAKSASFFFSNSSGDREQSKLIISRLDSGSSSSETMMGFSFFNSSTEHPKKSAIFCKVAARGSVPLLHLVTTDRWKPMASAAADGERLALLHCSTKFVKNIQSPRVAFVHIAESKLLQRFLLTVAFVYTIMTSAVENVNTKPSPSVEPVLRVLLMCGNYKITHSVNFCNIFLREE